MGGGSGLFDIILFAAIAAFLVFRLRGVLGKRTGEERQRPVDLSRGRPDQRARPDADDDKVVHLPGRAEPPPIPEDHPAAAGLTQIRVADPSFDPAGFVSGAKMAFEMIVTAFANGDRDTLRPLTAPELFQIMDTAMSERDSAGHSLESTLVSIDKAEIVEAEMRGSDALVTVSFTSEQINVTRDEEGQIISGSANAVDQVTDIWTFSRDTGSRDPNWILMETVSPS